MVTILLAPDGADAAITRSGFTVEFNAARRQWHYWPALAAPILYAVCRDHFTGLPARFRLPVAHIDPIRIGASATDRWIWLFREPNRILLFARQAQEEAQPEEPPPLRRWVSADRVYAIFDSPIPCAHCGVSSTRFRALADALVCSDCGRSWPVAHDDASMHFETAH